MNNFIPKPYKKEPITIRIDVDRLKEIDSRCIEYGTNRSEFINRCIEYSLENMQSTTNNDIDNHNT